MLDPIELPQPLVTTLGPAGTFSELAAREHFGDTARIDLVSSIDEVFRAIESGAAAFAVVPLENSTEGAIGRTLDLLAKTSARVCAEIFVRIRHQLLAREGTLGTPARVYSHAQSLAQCYGWLATHLPKAERIAVASNAEAARLASQEPGSVAIAGAHAAAMYGLSILAPNIEDEPDNTTRFFVLATKSSPATGRDRTSIVLSAKNEAGAVHALLQPLAARKVSMSRFESRPSRSGLWEYVFFVDLDGHEEDTNVAAALTEMAAIGQLKILGSYPKA